MTSTSLAEQLKKLSAPQSAIYKEDQKKASLLFDPKEAAYKDRDTFYEIGISGLHELITLYEGFRFYEDTLFSLSSKDFERAIQSKEVNLNLDTTIEKFLLQLSPYLLLQPSHKALEWLVNRYQIHKYNQDAIMALILPYHETKIFVRFIQLFDLKSTTNRWHWLKSIQRPGISLSKQVLFNQCSSNTATLQFIAKTVLKYVKEFGERASHLNTVYAFLCSVAIGTVNSSRKVPEAVINALLPTILTAIESPIADFRASAYVILGYLCTKAKVKPDTLNDIIDKLLNTDFDITYDIVLLINLMYTNQKHVTSMSETILSDISKETMDTICGHLKVLVDKRISVQSFAVTFFSSVLPIIQSNVEHFQRFYRLPGLLIDELDLKNEDPEKIVKCIIDAFQPQIAGEHEDDDSSDIEIIEENGFNYKIFQWFSTLLRKIESKYPDSFDKVIKKELSSRNENSDARRKQLSKILVFNPAFAHKVGGNYLFENLNNVNPEVRVEAVRYISREFESMKLESIDFVKDSIINRLTDEDINVVEAALEVPTKYLTEVLNEQELTRIVINIISKKSKKWKSVIKKAIIIFCSIESLPINQDTVLALTPYLFPNDGESAEITWNIINSNWGQRFEFTKKLQGVKNPLLRDNADVLIDTVFKSLFLKQTTSFDSILDLNTLNKNSTMDICVFLLLKSCSLKTSSVAELIGLLNLLLEAVEHRSVISSCDSNSFSSELLPELIKLSKKDQLLFEFMEYVFTRIIEDMDIGHIPKPWCNVCSTPELILVRTLYEICLTGCTIPTYVENYTKLLKKLLDKFFVNARQKCEFIANFAFGHILYASDPKDVIGPELQLRSLKLINNFIAVQQDANWLFESDIIMLMILFDLNNPVAAIRQFVLEIIKNLLRDAPNQKFIYVQLLNEIMTHSEEVILDHEQILQILKTILTKPSQDNKLFKKNCLLKLTSILIADVPAHIKSNLLKLLDTMNNAVVFSKIIPSLHSLENKIKKSTFSNGEVFDVYESNIIKNVYNHINEVTVSTFTQTEVWESIAFGLKQYNDCVLDESHSYTSPCILLLKQITEDIFKKIPEEKTKDIVKLITTAGTFSNNPTISSAASKVMRKIHVSYADFREIFDGMVNAADPAASIPKKKKSTVTMFSYQLTETEEWKLGVTLLEYVQSKKKMTVDNAFVSILFQLLYKCLRFEEQSYVEYTKQLILSALWYYCKKLVDVSDEDELKQLKSLFNVELVVQCIRGTQNPQTHHHALILLSHASYMLPEQVLHHTMEIFTFMGCSVLRHDDAYSFQIITKIIETLVPILVKLDKNIEDCTPQELQQLQNRVVPVLRIFADVVLHVPEHRRLPLFKKLVETLGANRFLWVFIALLLETHLAHFTDEKTKTDKQISRKLADQESPVNRLDFGQSILLEFPPEIVLENFIQLMLYIKSLPLQKDEHEMATDLDPKQIFSVKTHTAVQLRHYKYILVTFMASCISSSRFIQHTTLATNNQAMESHYKKFIVNILTFIQSISKIGDEKTAKYWRVMLHHSYDLLDHTNSLLSPPMFLSVVRGLLKHNLQTVRRKAMELLNSKIQFNPEMFEEVNKELLYSLLPELLDIIATINSKDENLSEITAQEIELNQQTALLSLKLLTRMLAKEDPEPFKPVLEKITEYTCNINISGNVMASVVLCLAELCGNLKAHALSSLRKFMPALIKVLKKQRKSETPELVLLSTVTAIAKIVESLPLFLSPYLQKMLYEYSILLAKWLSYDQECSKVVAIVSKLTNIKKKIAGSIPPRVLIPVANETHNLLLEKENYDAIGPVMSVLADSFGNITTADFTALQQDLTTFFINALQLRSDAAEKNIDAAVIDKAEDEVVNALVCLVLKLSETSFRPFYFKIYDWAIRTNVEGHKDRAITFYRLSAAIAEKLKGLFVLFAGHFIKNAADSLNSCNNCKTEELYFDSEEKCILMINYIVKTLHIVFLYDSQSFINKDRFETLMQPLVDQLENTIGGIESLKTRAKESLIPCISQFAVATGDDSLWKLLNYQVLLKTRHNDAEIRMMLGLPRYCSASGMFALTHTDGFQAVVRKRTASLLRRVRESSNTILKLISEKPDCPILRHMVHKHTHVAAASSRSIALDCLVSMTSQLGTSWLPLLAESVPFLAELLEDGDSKIEAATKDAIRKLEQILEEPLEKYF